MEHCKTICKITLFVACVLLQSCVLNNVNTLMTPIVHYYLNSTFFVYIPHPALMWWLCSFQATAGLELYPSYLGILKMCGGAVCDTGLSEADGNSASSWNGRCTIKWY